MTLRLGDTAPDFEAETTDGPVHFYDWKEGWWAVLFSHPADFTPVCTTELGRVAELKNEFQRRHTKVIGLSVDPLHKHHEWKSDIADVTGHSLNFPLIADADRKVSDLYDMVHPNSSTTATVRSVFIIDPANKVRVMLTYPASTGRNFQELLRVIDSLQVTDDFPVATPADWENGEDVIVAFTLSDDEAKELFPVGFETRKPYLRLTPDPRRPGARRYEPSTSDQL